MLRLKLRLTKSAVRLALFSCAAGLENNDPTGVKVSVPSDGGNEFDASPVIHG